MDDKLKYETVNFDKPEYFDNKYFMSYPSCLVRDSIQSLDRVRNTKDKVLYIHFLNDFTDDDKFYYATEHNIHNKAQQDKRKVTELQKIYLDEEEIQRLPFNHTDY